MANPWDAGFNNYPTTPELVYDDFYYYCLEEVASKPGIYAKNLHWFLIPAVLIIAVLSVLEKRRNIKPDLFGGRIAPVRPLSFLDEARNRWGIICVFGAVTGMVIAVVLKTFQADFPIWAKIFMIYLLSLEACVICYPLFACMTSRHRLVGAILGLLYSVGWFVFEMFTTIMIGRCSTEIQPSEGNDTTVVTVLERIPVMSFSLLLVIKFCHKLYKCAKHKHFKLEYKEQNKVCTKYQVTYVKYILARPAQQQKSDMTLRERIRSNVLGLVPGFRFPVTVLAAAFMSCVMLYTVGIVLAAVFEILALRAESLQLFSGVITASNVIASIATFACGIRNICVFLINYRSNMLSLYKGDRSFIAETVKARSPNVYMAQGMRFLGTAIVGTFWGTVFVYLFIFLPLASMMAVFKLLIDQDKVGKLIVQFQWAIYPACMIIIFQIQTLLIGRFLIQPKLNPRDKTRPLAVDNRTMYDILSFFFVFLNASIGLFTFLKRILMGAFMGIFLIPRMDRSLLLRGYEAMDKLFPCSSCYTPVTWTCNGVECDFCYTWLHADCRNLSDSYVNYIGMINVDLAHNHPVMRVFCHVIKECAEVTQYARPVANTVENPVYSTATSVVRMPVAKENSVAKRRWLIAYTLIRNPSLVADRRRGQHRLELDVNDIEYSESGDEFFQDDEDEFCLKRKWRNLMKCQCKCPRNLSTNLMATIVLLSIAILYVGLPLLIKDTIA